MVRLQVLYLCLLAANHWKQEDLRNINCVTDIDIHKSSQRFHKKTLRKNIEKISGRTLCGNCKLTWTKFYFFANCEAD